MIIPSRRGKESEGIPLPYTLLDEKLAFVQAGLGDWAVVGLTDAKLEKAFLEHGQFYSDGDFWNIDKK